MDTIKINLEKTKMIAHRGASGLECENSCSAFVLAGSRSYYGIETDVHVTKDGKYVVFHDNNAERMCGENMDIEGSTLDELKRLKLYDIYRENLENKNCRSDLVIPELIDYVRICKKYEKTSVLELKNPLPQENINEIIDILRNENHLDNTIFISFTFDNLVKVRKILPEQRVQFLTCECDDKLIERLVDNGFDIDIACNLLTEQLIEALKAKKIQINCWTVDDAEMAKKLISCGVDYISSNILE